MWKVVLLLAVTVTQNQASSFLENHAKGLVTINGTSYFISSPGTKVTMASALKVCKNLDMNLVSLQNQNKERMISDYLQSNGRVYYYYWTSGVRLYGDASSSTFVWFGSGDLVDYTNWYTDEPDNLAAHNVCIYAGDVNGIYWWDTDCDLGSFGVICEEKIKCRQN